MSEPAGGDAERQLEEIESGFGPAPADPMDPGQWRRVSPSSELVEHMKAVEERNLDRPIEDDHDWTFNRPIEDGDDWTL